MASSLANFDASDPVRLPVVRAPSPVGRAVIGMLEFLFELGRQWALREMILTARQEDIDALTGQARAYALGTSAQDYDPRSNEADRERANLFDGARAESRRLTEAIRNAAARSHEFDKEAAAKAALLGEPPAAPLLVMITAAAVVAMTMAPSAHDLVLTTLRDDLNWALSVSLGLVIGSMLVWGLIAEGSAAVVATRAALWGGIVLAGGFAVLRLSAAEDFGEVVFAIGLSVIEIGTLVFADAVGARYRAQLRRWQERKEEAADAAACAESARGLSAQLVDERVAVDRDVQAHLTYVDERRELSGDFESRGTAYVQAICAGYFRGIAENVGRAQGGYGNGA